MATEHAESLPQPNSAFLDDFREACQMMTQARQFVSETRSRVLRDALQRSEQRLGPWQTEYPLARKYMQSLPAETSAVGESEQLKA